MKSFCQYFTEETKISQWQEFSDTLKCGKINSTEKSREFKKNNMVHVVSILNLPSFGIMADI